jgi:hypothetical protein
VWVPGWISNVELYDDPTMPFGSIVGDVQRSAVPAEGGDHNAQKLKITDLCGLCAQASNGIQTSVLSPLSTKVVTKTQFPHANWWGFYPQKDWTS